MKPPVSLDSSSALALLLLAVPLIAQEVCVTLSPQAIQSASPLADFSGLADEQELAGDPPKGTPQHGWKVPSQHWRQFPYSAVIDLGKPRNLSALWFFDTNGEGECEIAAGEPGQWKAVATYNCRKYLQWGRVPLEVTTRFLRLELKSPGANFSELVLYEFTPEAHQALPARKAAEARARAERDAALKQAQEELARRPTLDLPPFGRVQLVEEVVCGAASPGHQFRESPTGVSCVESILGQPCRVLRPTEGEASYMTFRLGRWKLLKPGAAYVLAVDYPEDQPRSALVINQGNETSRGFHTGTTFGDALHPKYVNKILAAPTHVRDKKPIVPIALERVVQENLYLEALQAAPLNWGKWEVPHASPPADPSRYADTPGVLMTHGFHRAYTVASPKTFATFRGPSGLALIRHYALNEHMDFDKADQPKLGYFIADIERAGPACMMAEALAVANGDPTLLCYLQGGNYGRGFPQYVRAFNANFLALPALPSERLANADPDVVVRAIRTPAHGTYLAEVNASFAPRPRVAVQLPPLARGQVLEVVTAQPCAARDGAVELDFHPSELRTLRMGHSP